MKDRQALSSRCTEKPCKSYLKFRRLKKIATRVFPPDSYSKQCGCSNSLLNCHHSKSLRLIWNPHGRLSVSNLENSWAEKIQKLGGAGCQGCTRDTSACGNVPCAQRTPRRTFLTESGTDVGAAYKGGGMKVSLRCSGTAPGLYPFLLT